MVGAASPEDSRSCPGWCLVPGQWLGDVKFGTAYSHLHCSMGQEGRDLPSLGEVALTLGHMPCEFDQD